MLTKELSQAQLDQLAEYKAAKAMLKSAGSSTTTAVVTSDALRRYYAFQALGYSFRYCLQTVYH